MQITAELLDNDIAATEKQLQKFQQDFETMKALLAQTSGALLVLKNMRSFLDKPEPTVEEKPAVPIQELAEAVAGPGAVIEAIEEITEKPADMVVDANGKYQEKQ